jgi:hypothetical protein
MAHQCAIRAFSSWAESPGNSKNAEKQKPEAATSMQSNQPLQSKSHVSLTIKPLWAKDSHKPPHCQPSLSLQRYSFRFRNQDWQMIRKLKTRPFVNFAKFHNDLPAHQPSIR